MTKLWHSAIGIPLLAVVASAGTYTRVGGCLPGDIEIDKDCSAQKAAKAVCENAHDVRVAAADVALAAATAACALGYLEKGYPTQAACVAAAAAVHRLTVLRSRQTRDKCLGRVPDCIYTCEEADPPDLPCCNVPFAPGPAACAAAGHGYDPSRDCCI